MKSIFDSIKTVNSKDKGTAPQNNPINNKQTNNNPINQWKNNKTGCSHYLARFTRRVMIPAIPPIIGIHNTAARFAF